MKNVTPVTALVATEEAHAKYGASKSERFIECAGSINLEANAPPAAESPYAAEGTKAHACLEFLLKNPTKQKAARKAAASKWSAEMVEHASAAADYILERYAAAGPDAELLCETKVDSSPFTCEGQFGTLDAAIVVEFNRLTVIDYKYGAGVAVDPEGTRGRGNSQLVYYALAISHLYHHNFAEVELVVIQPRAFHPSGETTRTFVMSMPELLAWGPIFKTAVERTKAKDAPLAAGKWCKFCNAATICPELKDKAMREASVKFDASRVNSLVVPELQMVQLPHLGRILRACDKLEAWIGKVRDHAYHVLEKGGAIEGFKLVQKNSPRRWSNKEAVEAEAAKLWPDLAFTPPKLLSPAQLEKAVKGSKTWVAERTTSESSGLTMVDEFDKRPAISTSTKRANFPDNLDELGL